MIFDSHAHYDDKAFDGDRDALLSSFPQNGIEGVVNAGADRRSVWKTLELMRSEYGKRPACIHCFSYSREMAEEFLKLDYRIGIGGVVTFKNAKKIREVVEYLPMDRILLETDCPYLAPEPNRGKRNSSLNLPFVIRQIAEIKGIDPQEVEEITCRNAKEFFGIGTGA